MRLRGIKMRVFLNSLTFLLGSLLMAASFSAAGHAQQLDTIRIGGDYKFMTLRVDDSFKTCRRACEKDSSCRAWTFIKKRVRRNKGLSFDLGPDLRIGLGGRREVTPPQCRLKYSVGPSRSSNCCISGVKKVAARRRTGKAELCADYAEEALAQNDKNLSKRCDLYGAKWSGSYRKHYRWCMDVSARARKNRLANRDDELRSCRRGGRREKNRKCEQYADTAMTILEEAHDNKCGDKFPSWSKAYDAVYDWCLDHGQSRREDALEKARANLSSCLRRGGGSRIAACRDYADQSIEQVAKAAKNSCGFSGSGKWSDSYKHHYQLCRGYSRWRRSAKLKAALKSRKNAIESCIAEQSSELLADIGRIEVRQRRDNQWHPVKFKKRMNDPVVILGPASFAGGEPVHGRIRRVTSRGFEFKLEEFQGRPGHVRETLSYMAVEKGVHKFRGMVVEVGTAQVNADMVDGDWKHVDFKRDWRKTPIVFSQTQSYRGSDPVVTRMRKIDNYGFDIALSEKEADRRGHAREVVGYVAVKPGRIDARDSGGRNEGGYVWAKRLSKRINHRWTRIDFPRSYGDQEPALLVQSQTSRGPDTFDVRYRNLGLRSVSVRLQEETSRDDETRHTGEELGVLTLPYGKYWATASSDDGDDDASIQSCREYGQEAVKLQKRNRRLDCGFRGRHWSSDDVKHRRWCNRNGLNAASAKLDAMNARLDRCERDADSGGGVPVPVVAKFTAPKLLLRSFGRKAGGWNNRDHVRTMADVNGDGKADIVGFGNGGVYVSLNRRGSFDKPELWLRAYAKRAGGWNNRDHVRTMADVNGDGRADIVGFADLGVYVSLSRRNRFEEPELWLRDYGRRAGGWNTVDHVRTLADVNGDGKADIVGFGNKGVYVSLSRRGRFDEPELWLRAFGAKRGGWNNDDNVRVMADVNGDGRADVVGLAGKGVYVSLSRRNGFGDPKLWVRAYGRKTKGWQANANTWNDRYVFAAADVNGDGRADAIGFANVGVYTAIAKNSSFAKPALWLRAYGYKKGGWNNRDHVRLMADVNGDGLADVVGFANAGVYVAYRRKGEGAPAAGGSGTKVDLGCRKSSFRWDNDAISVGRGKGAFTAVKLLAKGMSVYVKNLVVTYGNGKSEGLSFSGKVNKNATTSAIDLSGRRRFIKSISFTTKSKVNFGKLNFMKGGGKLCVYGVK